MSDKIKCVIWDLDNTLWDGIIAEGDSVEFRHEARRLVEEFDRRGILQSVASKNDREPALDTVARFGVAEYFLYPQVGWWPKSESVARIAKYLDIHLSAVCLIDDDPFERDEAASGCPGLRTFDSRRLEELDLVDALIPSVITPDGSQRRLMYQSEIRRKEAEEASNTTNAQFLNDLGMVLSITNVSEGDLDRAEELTVRTHQLNTTGRSYSREELEGFSKSPDHRLLVASLEDRYGTYGKVGLILLHCDPDTWTIQLLLTSCRVISRGIGGILLHWLAVAAKTRGVRLQGEFVPNDRNRIMWITYHFANFRAVPGSTDAVILENDLKQLLPPPDFISLRVADSLRSEFGEGIIHDDLADSPTTC